ncbi:hypothetical protein HK098_004444 [Nowakowskiella sp. JEL0407]|nr:hypothetical protein HK098_004444 [Nowakowskiella sp. JEL0407]
MQGHPGPCHAYIGTGLKPTGWSKILEVYPTDGATWCNNKIDANGSILEVPIPKNLAPGAYVLSVQHIGLHVASKPGGAQFYIRCIDIIVTGSGTATPPYEIVMPGAWSDTTNGVYYNIYDGTPLTKYPQWGGSLWTGAGSASSSPAPTTKATTTTTPKFTTTTLVTSPSPASANCVQKYGQCGGSYYTGVTCCVGGTVCQVKSIYYSQCV